jgi:hypothetical protein
MIEYLDRLGPADEAGPEWDGSLTREPEPVPPHVDWQLRIHARTALQRVGWPPEPAADCDIERRRA